MSWRESDASVSLDGVDYLVEYRWQGGSPGCGPSLSYPGDPPEPPDVEFVKLTIEGGDDDGKEIELTEALETKLYELILERIDDAERDDYPEPDYSE